METIELIEEEQEIAKNQIAFDLDNLPEEEEESSSLPAQALSEQNIEWLASDTLMVVVKSKSSFAKDLCGRPIIDWVVMAGSGMEVKIVEDSDNIIDRLKSIQTDKQYMIVFYSDTPLVYKGLVGNIMDYFIKHRLNALTLIRGYVFKTAFLRTIETYISSCLESFDENAFTVVDDGESFIKANKQLQNRIFDFHERNGVILLDKKTTVIDADVEIDEGTIIKGNNSLKGRTIIGKNVYLEEGNLILNSILEDDVNLLYCRIVDSVVTKGKDYVALDIIKGKC